MRGQCRLLSALRSTVILAMRREVAQTFHAMTYAMTEASGSVEVAQSLVFR
jgi:hypothetical protein